MTTILALTAALALQTVAGPTSSPQSEAHAEIRGRVTDSATGAPVAGALVHVRRSGSDDAVMARTDGNGRYALTELRPGAYHGGVEAGVFRGTYLGEVLRDAAGRMELALKAGQVLDAVDVRLRRAAAINVRVVDEHGLPLSGLRVGARLVDTGRDAGIGWHRTTDDRGRLRLYGLVPGRYVVCADTGMLGTSAGSPSPAADQFLTTCYPSATEEAQAQPITPAQADGEEFQITMRRGRVVTVSGVVLDAAGVPARAMLSLTHFTQSGSASRGIVVAPDGRFRIDNVPPGTYAIQGELGGPDRPGDRRPHQSGFLPVRVDSADVADLVVQLTATTSVAGQVTFEDLAGPAPNAPGSGLGVWTRLADDQQPGGGAVDSALVAGDGTFTLERIFGRRLLEVINVPRGWYTKSIRYGNADVAGTAIDFTTAGDSPIEIVLSRRGATIDGRVVDGQGRAVRRALVMVITTDQSQWTLAHPHTAFSNDSGVFRIGPMRGGEYYVLALPPGTLEPDPRDRERMARLAQLAERVSVEAEEARQIELRVARPE